MFCLGDLNLLYKFCLDEDEDVCFVKMADKKERLVGKALTRGRS
jgi:hypothetical protein